MKKKKLISLSGPLCHSFCHDTKTAILKSCQISKFTQRQHVLYQKLMTDPQSKNQQQQLYSSQRLLWRHWLILKPVQSHRWQIAMRKTLCSPIRGILLLHYSRVKTLQRCQIFSKYFDIQSHSSGLHL